MAIDDELNKIKEGRTQGGPQQPKPEETSSPVEGFYRNVADIEKALGDFTVSFLNLREPTSIGILGPYILTLSPVQDSHKLVVADKAPKMVWLRLLNSIDPYLAETDLADVGDPVETENILRITRPYIKFVDTKEVPYKIGPQFEGKYNPKSFHPYVFAMGITLPHRLLAGKAVYMAIQERALVPYTEDTIPPIYSKNAAEIIAGVIPPITYLAKAAKELQETSIKPALEALEALLGTYEQAWG